MVRRNIMVWVPILGVHLPRENEPHLALLHNLPCVVTGAPCEEVHHPKGLGWGCGMGQKAPDEAAIPLTKAIHDEYHRIGVKSFEAKYGTHEVLLAKTQRLLRLN